MTTENIDINGPEFERLLQKFDLRGPRYTSYPTVPYWETSPTPQQWMELLREEVDVAEKQNMGCAVYIHIPFCESMCTYCGCHKVITKNHAAADPFNDALLGEWKLYLQGLGRGNVSLSELHLGGGTPTFYTPDQLKFLLEPILKTVTLTQDAEMSFEADPRVTSKEHLKTMYELGFRRLSLGIQDFDPVVQDIVNRVQSPEQVKELTDAARELGYTGVNYDLVYGLPLQTIDSIDRTFDHLDYLKPDRIAFYSYAHVPWIKPTQRKYKDEDIPAADEKRALYEKGRVRLKAAAYQDIGLDHFALETDDLWKAVVEKTLFRNFMGYMPRRVSPMIGLGASSIGDSRTCFAQNEKDVGEYQKIIQEGKLPVFRGHVLTDEDIFLREHILNLMCQGETSWEAGGPHETYLSTVGEFLNPYEEEGLVTCTPTSVKIAPHASAFMRNICMAFDARLQRKQPTEVTFSKTI